MEERNAAHKRFSPNRNAFLMISAAGALCMFAVPSKTLLLLEIAVYIAMAFMIRIERNRSIAEQGLQPSSLFLGSVFTLIASLHFFSSLLDFWLYPLKNVSGINLMVIALAITVACGGTAGYAFYCLAHWMDMRICAVLHATVSDSAFRNLKKNWFFPVSAVAFFLLQWQTETQTEYLYSILAAGGIATIVACRMHSLWNPFKNISWPLSVLAMLSTAGICWFPLQSYAHNHPCLCIACAAAAFPFVGVCVLALFHKLENTLKGVFSDVKLGEFVLYGVIAAVMLCFVTVTFFKTDAFYGTACDYDIIYTSDSPMLVRDNAYLWLTYGENDLRQPLFAVFSSPFMGAAFFLSKLFSVSPALNALLMDLPQILLLYFSHFLLAKAMKLTGLNRIGFMLLICSSYPTMLFSLMMEQYIFAYFYLTLLLYSFSNNRPEPLAYWGTSGTLLTGAILLPIMSEKHPVQEFKMWLRDMLNRGIEFVVFILAFARLDVLFGAAANLSALRRFAGEGLSALDRLSRYLVFIESCLYATSSRTTLNELGSISWQQSFVTGVPAVGAVILILLVISMILNRDKKISRAAAAWTVFSFALLCIVGWGMRENGLILYTLYFGWAFHVLLFQLAERIESMWKIKHLTFAVSLSGAVLLAWMNIAAIGSLAAFAIAEYPL